MQLLTGHGSVVYSLAFALDGRLVASDKEGQLNVWDAAGRLYSVRSPVILPAVYTAVWRQDQILYTNDTTVFRVRPDEEEFTHGKLAVRVAVPAIALAALDDDRLVIGCGSRVHRQPGELIVWDLSAGQKRLSVPEPHGVRAVAAHPESGQVAWATAQNRVSVRDIARPDPVHFPLPANCPAVAFHPDGQTLAAAVGWTVTLFDIGQKRERRTLKGHTGPVAGLAFSPDGRTLATGSWDGTVRLWEPDTGAERTAFRWPVGRVFSLAYDADGLRLAAGGDQGAVVVWDAE